MTGAWSFTALEFDVLWRLLGRDRLPYPLVHRGDAATEAGYRAARRAATQRIVPRLSDTLHEVLSVLFAPVVRIEVFGVNEDAIRVHGAVRSGVGVIARQLPGIDLDSGGDVRITVVPASGLAAAIVAALPPAGRGAGPGVQARPAGAQSGSLLRRAGRLDADEARRRFFDRPRIAVGEVGVLPGTALDWRPSGDGAVVHWTDVADGRYLVRGVGGDEATAAPVSGEEFAAELGMLIGDVSRQANTTSHTAT